MKSTLKKLASKLNNHHIHWGLGGSAMLCHYQITDVVNDIDILIDEQDAKKVESIFSTMAEKEEAISKEPFATKSFLKYRFEDTSIDIMGGFQIYHEQGLYTLDFDQASIAENVTIDNICIALSSLEDWYILYSLIPGRQYKAELIESYWKVNSIGHPNLLKRALQKPLPGYLVNNLRRLQYSD